MIKQQYATKFGAIWNIVSNRNYSMPLFYKSLYILYYFATIVVILELLFDKTYIILSLISSLIIVINGRKYDDPEQQLIEYLPISSDNKARYIYYTIYVSLFFGGLIAFGLDFLYRRANPIEYIYAIVVVIALSNLAIIQMIYTKKSLIYFFLGDILIYQLIVSIFRFSLIGVYSAFTGPKYDITQFNTVKLLLLIVITIVYHFVCVNIISNSKKNTKLDKKDKIKLVLILILLLSASGYKFYKNASQDFSEGVKEASKEGIIVGNNKESIILEG